MENLIQLLEKAKKFHLLGKISEAQKIYLSLIKKKTMDSYIFYLEPLFYKTKNMI